MFHPMENNHSIFHLQSRFSQVTKMAEHGCLSFNKTFPEVCNYRVLYGKEYKDFKDKKKKLQAWEKVGNEIGMTKSELQ